MTTLPVEEIAGSDGRASAVSDDAVTDEAPVSDDELERQALAADPDTGVAADAVPLGELLGGAGDNDGGRPGAGGLLPAWYMPPAVGGSRVLRGWRRRLVLVVIASFVLINAYGLCSTYGHVGFG